MKIFFTKEKGWQIDVTVAGQRIRESGFGKKKEAEEFFLELKMQAKRGKYRLERDRELVTVERLVAERLVDTSKHAAARQVKRILKSFAASFPADFPIEDVTAGHVREWAREFKRRGLKAETINRYLYIVAAMFRAAPSMFPDIEEDWRGPKFYFEKVSQRGRQRVISDEESTTLLEALRFPGRNKDGGRYGPPIIFARREVADCLELALNTGMRGKEVRCLEWSEIELAEGEIHLPGGKTKTGEPRDVLLNQRALDILRRRLEARTSRFVFPNPKGDRPRTEISNVIRPVARRLGLRYGRNLPDGFSPHDTRHTATTRMLRRGHDLKTVQDVLGHSDKVMTLRYSHSTRASRRAAVDDLGRTSGKVENNEHSEEKTG